MKLVATRIVLGVILGVGLVLGLAACGVEKFPPLRMTHRGAAPAPHRIVVLPVDCVASETVRTGRDPRAWCQGIDTLVASELSFRGMEVVDLARLPAQERVRTEVEVRTQSSRGRPGTFAETDRTTVQITGPMYSDVDVWTQRNALEALGVDGLARVRIAHLPGKPVRVAAVVRVARASDAALVAASTCELEVSRLDTTQETFESAVRCALRGLPVGSTK